ncbi:hypothetical protein THICB6_160054 [Thiomonas arsenitoxydans]|nr:hypothetical protein THICB6_160054 [Thiomonas arsenitoxydans]
MSRCASPSSMRMMVPLPNCFSICDSAAASALAFSGFTADFPCSMAWSSSLNSTAPQCSTDTAVLHCGAVLFRLEDHAMEQGKSAVNPEKAKALAAALSQISI